MARTEKKFGQVNQPAANTSVELVPSSATRKNVLLNISGRTSTPATATVYTATGSLTHNSVTVTPSLQSQTGIAFSGAGGGQHYAGPYLIPDKTGFYVMGPGQNGTVGLFTVTTAATTLTPGSFVNTYTTWQTQVDSSARTQFFTDYNYGLTPRLVALDTQYALMYHTSIGSSSDSYFQEILAQSTAPTAYRYAQAPGGGLYSAGWRIAGVCAARQEATGTNGIGYSLWYRGNSVAAGVLQAAMRIYRNNTVVTAHWIPTTGTAQGGNNLYAFFTTIHYNSAYPQYAIGTPTSLSSANAWYGVSQNGGTMTGTATLPTETATKSGIRFVATTAGSTSATDFLTGAFSYPTGTMTTLAPQRTDNPVRCMRFSPDGTKLAVMWNRSYGSGVSFNVTSRRLINNVATLTLELGNISDHTYQVGESVTVASVAAPFNGTFTITARTASTISYAVTNANIQETATTSGTTNVTKANNLTNSVVTIFTRQNDGTWIETHQSGTNVSSVNSQIFNVGLAWDSTSSLLAIAAANVRRIWNFGGASLAKSYVSSSNGWTISGEYPNITSLTSPSSGSATTTNTTQWIVPTTEASYSGASNSVEMIEWLPFSGQLDRLVIGSYQTSTNKNTSTVTDTNWNRFNVSGTATISGGYVNTVGTSIPASSGSVVQISNILIEPGEKLYVEANTSNALDIVAYGVEIS